MNIRFLVAFAAFVLGCASPLLALHEADPVFTRIAETNYIPAEIMNRAMYVSVMVNGKGPYRMLVDTGCSVTLISPKVADAADVREADIDGEEVGDMAMNGVGDSAVLPRVMLESLSIGNVRFEGVTADVQSLALQAKIDGRPVDGILGYALFADLYMGLDYARHRLILSPTWPTDIPSARVELAVTEHHFVPFIEAKLQGQPIEVMIDSGANQGLQLTGDVAGRFRWKNEPRPGALIATIGETDRTWAGRLDGELALGNFRQLEPVAAVSRRHSTIGVAVLENFCVVFHESENKVWFCANDDAPIRSPAEKSLGLSFFWEQTGWRVAGVIPGSPAEEAHLLPGTLVTEIEGKPANTWSRDQLQRWINTHDAVALAVDEQSGPRSLKLRVWSLVP